MFFYINQDPVSLESPCQLQMVDLVVYLKPKLYVSTLLKLYFFVRPLYFYII